MTTAWQAPETGEIALLGAADGVHWRMWDGRRYLICDGTNGTPDRSKENALMNPRGRTLNNPEPGDVVLLGMTDGSFWRMWDGTRYVICDGTNGTPDRSEENALMNPKGRTLNNPEPGDVVLLGMTDGSFWRMWDGTRYVICDGTNGTPDRSEENALMNPTREG